MALWTKVLAYKKFSSNGLRGIYSRDRYVLLCYLNKVELQNGFLAQGHSNVFIPSTIHRSNLDDNGKLCEKKLEKNLNAATKVYISAMSGAPCFGTKIHLVKRATDEVS